MTSFSDPNTIAHTAHWRESSMNCVKHWTEQSEWLHSRPYHVTRTSNIKPMIFPISNMNVCVHMYVHLIEAWWESEQTCEWERTNDWMVCVKRKQAARKSLIHLFSGLCQCVFCILFIMALYRAIHTAYAFRHAWRKTIKCQYQIKP